MTEGCCGDDDDDDDGKHTIEFLIFTKNPSYKSDDNLITIYVQSRNRNENQTKHSSSQWIQRW